MVWNQWQVLNYFEEIFTNDSINLEMCNIYVVSCGYHWFFIGWGFTAWWNKCEKISTGTHNVIIIIMFQELLAPRFWPCCQLQVIFIPKWITMMLIARRKLSVSSWISQKCLVRHMKIQTWIIWVWQSGQGGTQVKSGVQWAASWLAPFGFSIVDQISEAATLNDEVRIPKFSLNDKTKFDD